MARKNVLMDFSTPSAERTEKVKDSGTTSYAMRGASKSMLSSIGELASQAARAEMLLEGASVVELETELVDGSFVSDRMDGGEEAFNELLEAVREKGQDTPILVRPHPKDEGRYMVVFGHRRLKVAKELGKTVKAIIKDIDDADHVIAQGQENSARNNLSFIERAAFAQRLIDLQYDRDTVLVALSIDNPMLTRMLSVTKRVPHDLIEVIGAAKTVGRDRWIDFASLYEKLAGTELAAELTTTEAFKSASSDERFGALYKAVLHASKPVTKVKLSPAADVWAPADKSVSVTTKLKSKTTTVEFASQDGKAFASWLISNLKCLYEDFRQSEKEHSGV